MHLIHGEKLPPFLEECALNKDRLDPPASPNGSSSRIAPAHPISPQNPSSTSTTISYIPDQPTISLNDADVYEFLDRELSTSVLDELYPWLWLVGTMKGTHIDPLHEHLAKNKRILVAEDPKLHMLWFKDMVYIKPIPPALLNYDFWEKYLGAPQPVKMNSNIVCPRFDRTVALGFLRSYAYLIRHRSDLTIAITHGLLPADIPWEAWERFIYLFRQLDDSAVAKRYHFGQLRISRLNLAVRIFRPRVGGLRTGRHYREMYNDTTSFLERFFAPLLFIFATASLMLSAMQVAVSFPQSDIDVVKKVFWGYCLFNMVGLCFCFLVFIFGPLLYWTLQLCFGYRMKKRSEKSRTSNVAKGA